MVGNGNGMEVEIATSMDGYQNAKEERKRISCADFDEEMGSVPRICCFCTLYLLLLCVCVCVCMCVCGLAAAACAVAV